MKPIPKTVNPTMKPHKNLILAALIPALLCLPPCRAAAQDGGGALYETAKWNQLWPYYNQCPETDGLQTLTGCGTTATAIVMRHHRWPERGHGQTEEYTTYSPYIDAMLTVPARDLEHEYLWDDMPLDDLYGLNTSGLLTQEATDAVAGLMADVGAAMHSEYDCLGTNVTDDAMLRGGFDTFFGYSPNAHWDSAIAHSPEEWLAILQGELDSVGPIIYIGYEDERKEIDGHCFVLDGYTSDGLFHVNLGWGGECDGYYALDGLTPDECDFTQAQSALLGMRPYRGERPESTLGIYPPGLSSSAESIVQGQPFTLSYTVANVSIAPFAGELRAAMTDESGAVIEWLSTAESVDAEMGPADIAACGAPLQCVITSDVAAGDRIRLFYRQDETAEWKQALRAIHWEGDTEGADNEPITQWELVLEDAAAVHAPHDAAASNATAYDLSGRPISAQPPRGIYIKDGTKRLAR